jgi:hypothetical protein
MCGIEFALNWDVWGGAYSAVSRIFIAFNQVTGLEATELWPLADYYSKGFDAFLGALPSGMWRTMSSKNHCLLRGRP